MLRWHIGYSCICMYGSIGHDARLCTLTHSHLGRSRHVTGVHGTTYNIESRNFKFTCKTAANANAVNHAAVHELCSMMPMGGADRAADLYRALECAALEQQHLKRFTNVLKDPECKSVLESALGQPVEVTVHGVGRSARWRPFGKRVGWQPCGFNACCGRSLARSCVGSWSSTPTSR